MGNTYMPESETNELQCCICKETVEREETSRLDPCGLVLTANFDSPRPEQKEQTFYCHFECFRSLVRSDDWFYISEPDFPTVGEADD
jgi:hypothetical protein